MLQRITSTKSLSSIGIFIAGLFLCIATLLFRHDMIDNQQEDSLTAIYQQYLGSTNYTLSRTTLDNVFLVNNTNMVVQRLTDGTYTMSGTLYGANMPIIIQDRYNVPLEELTTSLANANYLDTYRVTGTQANIIELRNIKTNQTFSIELLSPGIDEDE